MNHCKNRAGRLLPLAICLLGMSLTAQSQNVGIGTINPAGKLHIDLSTSATPYAILIDDDGDPVIRIRKGGISRAFLQLDGDDVELGSYATNPLGNLVLHTNGQNRVYISPSGNVGIGIAAPTSRLHLLSSTDVSLTSNGYLMMGTAGGANIAMDNNEIQARDDSAASTLYLQALGGKLNIGNPTDENLQVSGVSLQALFNGSAETLILQSSGGKVRLGNGFDFSNTKLHVSTGVDAGIATNQSGYLMLGMSTAENLVFDNNEILARNNGVAATLFLARDGSKVQLGNGTEGTGTKLHITSGNDVDLSNANSGYLMMGSQTGTNLVADINEIQVRNNGAASHLYLQNNGGSVFIGDATDFNSSHRLGVNGNTVITGALRVGTTVTPAGYKLAVDGKVICTEVLVRVVANWPDYVFDEQYQLRPLPDLEAFIRKHHHLPGIPDAAAMEANGISLGEMQKLQMQKIEELTLYIIELRKEIDALKKTTTQQ